MTDDVATLGRVISATPPVSVTQSPRLYGWSDAASALKYLEDDLRAPAHQARSRKLLKAELLRLVDLISPPPPSGSAKPQDVLSALVAASRDQSALDRARTQFLELRWKDRWEVLQELGQMSSATTGTLLDAFDPLGLALTRLDLGGFPEFAATVLVALLKRGDSGLQKVNEPLHWWLFARLLCELNLPAQTELITGLGLPADSVDGLVTMLQAEFDSIFPDSPAPTLTTGAGHPLAMRAAASGGTDWFSRLKALFDKIDPDGSDSLPVNKGNQPWSYYIGNAVHKEIAAYYRAAHEAVYGEVGGKIWTNTVTIATILANLQKEFNDAGLMKGITAALLASRPDIYELTTNHGQPPGWVYEIKPWTRAPLAVFESLFYADALTLCGIPVIPGPPTIGPGVVPGTDGVVPIPGGWAAFCCPAPGAIIYKVKYKTREKKPQPVPATEPATEDVRDKVRRVLIQAAPTPQQTTVVATAGLLAILWAALVEYGWVVVVL